MWRTFDRYVLREVLPPFLLGLLVCSFVLLMNQILILTEQIVTRGVTLPTMFKLLGSLMPAILAFAVPMAVLMGILAGLSRLSSDSEIVAFKTLGIGHGRLLRPLLLFALAGWLLTSFLTLYLAPRTNVLYVRTYVQGVLRRVPFRVAPRVFNEALNNMVIYVQDLGRSEQEWRNVLLFIGADPQEPRLILAQAGRLDVSPDLRKTTLQLASGADHSYPLDAPEKYKITFFKSLREEIPIETALASISFTPTVREKDILGLLRGESLLRRELRRLESPGEDERRKEIVRLERAGKRRELRSTLVEIHKRFALPFTCLVFVFLALPLGISTRKGGRTSGFTVSLGIIVVYYVLITAGEQLARDGSLPPWLGMWGPNIVFTLFSLVLYLRSERERPLFLRLPKLARGAKRAVRTAAAAAAPRRKTPLFFPRILDRYIMRRYAALFSLVFLGLMAITVVITFFERMNTVYEHRKPVGMLIRFIWFTLPDFSNYILPVSALAAMLLTLGILTKFNEITAMKASGISLYRIVVPVVLLAVLVSLLSFTLQERVLPTSNLKANQTWDAINDLPPRSYNPLERTWLVNRAKDRFFHYLYFEPDQGIFRQISVIDVEAGSWRIARRLYAGKAVLRDRTLTLVDGWVRNFREEVPVPYERFERLELALEENREFFLREWKTPSQMTLGELGRYIGEVKELGFDTVRFRVDWHSRLSLPLVAVIMTLIGIPFAFAMGKRGTLVGIAVGVVIAMLYWGALGFFRGLGYAGTLNPFLAAWAPNIIFGLAGIYGLFALRT